MTGANRWQVALLVLGVGLGAGSLIGANRLLHQPDSVGGGGQPAKSNGTPLKGGIVVLGTVDSVPSPSPVGPPAVAPLATVKKVLVREGQEVKPGDPLVQFDDAIYRGKLEQAKAQAAAAELDVKLAEKAKENHEIQLEQQRAAIEAAEQQLKLAKESQRIAKDQLEQILALPSITQGGEKLTEAQKQKRRDENLDLRQLEAKILELQAKADYAKKELQRLQLDPVDLKAQQAQTKVEGLKGAVREAQAAVDALLVKADIGGVVEQLRAVEGMTYGPSTREPVLILVPSGKRVVRAEVQAEFAYKMAGVEGKKVTVCDDTNFALTYEGTVRRVATSFLPKRAADVSLTVSPTKILEVEIDVADPAPADKPPLRVGQPVRVLFE